jgi:hypothetical protein
MRNLPTRGLLTAGEKLNEHYRYSILRCRLKVPTIWHGWETALEGGRDEKDLESRMEIANDY